VAFWQYLPNYNSDLDYSKLYWKWNYNSDFDKSKLYWSEEQDLEFFLLWEFSKLENITTKLIVEWDILKTKLIVERDIRVDILLISTQICMCSKLDKKKARYTTFILRRFSKSDNRDQICVYR
jgi:hypothetical protein